MVPIKPIPTPLPTFKPVPKVEEPKDADELKVVLPPVLPNKPPGFCCPNKVVPLPNVKPVFVPKKDCDLQVINSSCEINTER